MFYFILADSSVKSLKYKFKLLEHKSKTRLKSLEYESK